MASLWRETPSMHFVIVVIFGVCLLWGFTVTRWGSVYVGPQWNILSQSLAYIVPNTAGE